MPRWRLVHPSHRRGQPLVWVSVPWIEQRLEGCSDRQRKPQTFGYRSLWVTVCSVFWWIRSTKKSKLNIKNQDNYFSWKKAQIVTQLWTIDKFRDKVKVFFKGYPTLLTQKIFVGLSGFSQTPSPHLGLP